MRAGDSEQDDGKEAMVKDASSSMGVGTAADCDEDGTCGAAGGSQGEASAMRSTVDARCGWLRRWAREGGRQGAGGTGACAGAEADTGGAGVQSGEGRGARTGTGTGGTGSGE